MNSSNLSIAFKTMKQDCENRSEASLKFYNAVRKEILGPLNTALKEQENRIKEINKLAKANEQKYSEIKYQTESEHLKYTKTIKELDENIAGYDSMKDKKDFSEDKKTKLISKINQLLKEAKDCEKAYRMMVYQAKETRIDYIKGMELALDMYQKEEEERILIVKNTFLTLLSKEQALNLARSEKIESRIESINKLSKEAEIESILKKIDPKIKQVDEIQYKKVHAKSEGILQKFDSYYSKGGAVTPFNFEAARLSISTGIDEEIDEKTQELTITIKKALSHCWEAKGLTPAEKEQFKDVMKDKTARKLFCECMNYYRKQGLFSMTHKGFSCVADLLLSCFIPQIEKDMDIENALMLIILSETFYVEQKNIEGGTDRIFIQQAISEAKLFHNEEFWAKVLDCPLGKSNASEKVDEETAEEKAYREASEVFAKLGTYAHNMLQFNLEKAFVEKLIFQYATKKGLSKQYVDAIQVFYKNL